ncbi:MAG: hypothetical protein KF766_08120 [Rhodocyclaceae bacterium]|nr:hypothetical protein [Rhodocyclaceae bacterium]
MAKQLGRLADVVRRPGASQRRPRVNVSRRRHRLAVKRCRAWPPSGDRARRRRAASADNRIVDLAREDIDLATTSSAPMPAPPGAALLFEEEVFPVAAPGNTRRSCLPSLRPDLAKADAAGLRQQHKAVVQWEALADPDSGLICPTRAVLEFNQYDQLITREDGRGTSPWGAARWWDI